MASRKDLTGGLTISALFLIFLLCGHEVHAHRQEVLTHTSLMDLHTLQSMISKAGVVNSTGWEWSELWDSLFGGGSEGSQDPETFEAANEVKESLNVDAAKNWEALVERSKLAGRCDGDSKELLMKAFGGMVAGTSNMAGACEAANAEERKECLGSGSGQSSVGMFQHSKQFPSVITKFAQCDWAKDVFGKLQSSNTQLIRDIGRTWTSAPEFATLREKVDLDFAAFEAQADAAFEAQADGMTAEGTTALGDEDGAKNGMFEAVRKLFKRTGPSASGVEAFASAEEYAAKEKAQPDETAALTALDQLINVEWCYRGDTMMGPSHGCGKEGQACFGFTVGDQSSEKMENKAEPPDSSELEMSSLSLETTTSCKARIPKFVAGKGIVSMSCRYNDFLTWGICLSKDSPEDDLQDLKREAKSVEERGNEALRTAALAATSLIQRTEGGVITKNWAKWVLQVPAMIGMFVLLIMAILVFLVVKVLQWVVLIVTAGPLVFTHIFGLGFFFSWVLQLPMCLLGGAFAAAAAAIYSMLVGVFQLGAYFGGMDFRSEAPPFLSNMYDEISPRYRSRAFKNIVANEAGWCDPWAYMAPCGFGEGKSGYRCF